MASCGQRGRTRLQSGWPAKQSISRGPLALPTRLAKPHAPEQHYAPFSKLRWACNVTTRCRGLEEESDSFAPNNSRPMCFVCERGRVLDRTRWPWGPTSLCPRSHSPRPTLCWLRRPWRLSAASTPENFARVSETLISTLSLFCTSAPIRTKHLTAIPGWRARR